MNKKYGMSVVGFAIVVVIMLGLVMIISAPSFVSQDNGKNDENKNSNNQTDVYFQIQEIENRLNSRIDSLENNVNSLEERKTSASLKDKYVCTMQSRNDENDDTVQNNTGGNSKKFIFECEYKH